MPKTAAGLAKIALGEVNIFSEAVSGLKFGQKDLSRAAVLRVSAALKRVLDVGVVISALPDAAQT